LPAGGGSYGVAAKGANGTGLMDMIELSERAGGTCDVRLGDDVAADGGQAGCVAAVAYDMVAGIVIIYEAVAQGAKGCKSK